MLIQLQGKRKSDQKPHHSRELQKIWLDLAPLIQHYEDKDDEESLFVWSVDKIQALVQSKLDNYHAYYSQGVTSDEARRVQGNNIARAHPKVAPFYREVFEQFMNDYDDTAVKKDGEVITHNRASRT